MGQERTVLLTCAGTPVRGIDLQTSVGWGELKSIYHPTEQRALCFLYIRVSSLVIPEEQCVLGAHSGSHHSVLSTLRVLP